MLLPVTYTAKASLTPWRSAGRKVQSIDKQTIQWRKGHDARHATQEGRLMRLEETAAQKKGALGLFFKLGTIVTTLALLVGAIMANIKGTG